MKATLKINDKEIEVEITEEELKKLEEKKPSRKRWRAEKNQEYWYIRSDGDVDDDIELHYEMDNWKYSIGNYFKTKEEAEFHKKELIYTQMLKDYIYEHDDVELNWHNSNQNKYFMFYSYYEERIDYYLDLVNKYQGIVYASNKQVLEDAIKFIGEENVKKYILKVEEQQ